jgi:hypothetical protein
MTAAERKKQLHIVAEMLLVHLPAVLEDQALARDLLVVVSLAIRAAAADAEKSATAWDARAYHVRADALRREWAWASGAANYAAGLADRAGPLTAASLDKLRALIDVPLTQPTRCRYKSLDAFRGAREATLAQAGRGGKRPLPKRSLV